MKLIAMALVAMFSSTWSLAFEFKPGEDRCNLAKVAEVAGRQKLGIPPAAARAADPLCHKTIWNYLDHNPAAASQKALFLETVNDVATVQTKVLSDLNNLFKNVDLKEKAAEEAVKALEEAFAKAKGTNKTDALSSLKGLLEKEGAALLPVNGADLTEEAAKSIPAGGPLYGKFVEQIYALTDADLVKRHLSDAVTWDAGKQKLSLAMMRDGLWRIDDEGARYVVAPAICDIQKYPKRPAFCNIDWDQGARIRALFTRSQAVLNGINEYVRTKGVAEVHDPKPAGEHAKIDHTGTVAETLSGWQQVADREAGAATELAKKAYQQAALESFAGRIGSLTAEELFDGASLAKFKQLDAPQQAAELEKVRQRAKAEVADVNGEKWLLVNGKKFQKITVPEGLRDVEAAQKLAAAEGKKIADAYIKGDDFKAGLMELGYAIKPEGSTNDNGGGGGGDGGADGVNTGCDSISDIARSDVERARAKKLDTVLDKKKASSKERERISKELAACIEKSSDTAKSDIANMHSSLNPVVGAKAAWASHEKRVVACEEFAMKEAEKLKDTTTEASELADEAYKADNTVEAWFYKQVEKGAEGLKKEYIANVYNRLSTLSFESRWSPKDLTSKLPGKEYNVIEGYFKDKWNGAKVKDCATKLGWKRPKREELDKKLESDLSASDATPDNIDSKCGVRDELPKYVQGLTGKLGTDETQPTDDEARKKRCEELKKKGIPCR